MLSRQISLPVYPIDNNKETKPQTLTQTQIFNSVTVFIYLHNINYATLSCETKTNIKESQRLLVTHTIALMPKDKSCNLMNHT